MLGFNDLALDVSNNNGLIDWAALAKPGKVRIVFAKATQGVSFTDKYFGYNRMQAKAHNVVFGAYHFYQPGQDPVEQALHFCTVVQQVGKKDARPVLDFEQGGVTEPYSAIHAFNQRVEKELGVLPLFYSDRGFIDVLKLSQPVGAGLWLADYGVDNGQENAYIVPSPWKKAALHQFTDRGTWPGISGHVDMRFVKQPRPLLAHPVLALV